MSASSAVSLFYEGNPDMVFYAADDDRGGAMLCGTVSDLASQLRQTMWRIEQPIILTSGTLAVGQDFSRFRAAAGLTGERRVTESVTPSPFDYRQNCLLFLPRDPYRLEQADYYDKLAGQIRELATASTACACAVHLLYRPVRGQRPPPGSGDAVSCVRYGPQPLPHPW